MDGFHNISLEQAADLIASRVRVKQAGPGTADAAPAADSLNKTMIGVRKLQSDANRANDPQSRASDSYHSVEPPADPGIADRVRAMLGNIDFSSLATKGMDAAKGFSPGSNPLHAALLGGGLGMGVGALGSLTSSDKEKRKRWLRNALFGGAMGGIGGGALYGMGAGLKGLADDRKRQDAELHKPQVPTLPDRVVDITGETAAAMGGKGLPSVADLKQLRDTAGEKIYNFGAPVVDKIQNFVKDPAGAIEGFRKNTLQPALDNPGATAAAVADKAKGAVTNLTDGVSGAMTDVANNPDAFKQSINDNIGQYRGFAPIVGSVVGATTANALNRHADQKQLQQTVANPKFTPFVTGKNGVNEKLRNTGHPEVTPQQLAAAGGVRPAGFFARRPPAMSSTQNTAMSNAVKSFNPAAAPKHHNRGLWGAGGTVLGAVLGSQYTPHQSIAQKQQQEAMLPSF